MELVWAWSGMTRRSTCLVNLSGAVEEADAEFQREPHTRDWRTETGDWTLLLPRPPNQAKTTPKKNNPKKNPKANNDTESLAFLGRKGRGIPALGWSNWRPWPAASSARNRGDVTLPWVSCPFQFQVATGACGACRSGLGALWGATQARYCCSVYSGACPRGCSSGQVHGPYKSLIGIAGRGQNYSGFSRGLIRELYSNKLQQNIDSRNLRCT